MRPDGPARRSLIAAADPFPDDPKVSVDAIDEAAGPVDWDKYALVIWAGVLPAGEVAEQLDIYVKSGGALICFPPGEESGSAFESVSWGAEKVFGTPLNVTHWDAQDSPLANAESGSPLALSTLRIQRARPITSGGGIRAVFGDNQAFLTEREIGKGRVYFCSTLPQPDWSNLGDGQVLVPMLQRILQLGARRFAAGSFLAAGDASLLADPDGWISLDAPGKDVRTQAGFIGGERG